MLRLQVPLVLLVGMVLLGPVAADEAAKTEKKTVPDAKAVDSAFERLKKLAGDWQLANPKDEASKGKIVERYRLTAGGSAIVETHFPGDDHEMVTIYNRDGDQLLLTHYCHLGNQPQMRAKIGDNKDELVFEFAGGSNLNPAKDTHMHNCRIRFVDADHIQGEWELYVDGKSAGKHAFDLVRKK
jgi:hypothetical protein